MYNNKKSMNINLYEWSYIFAYITIFNGKENSKEKKNENLNKIKGKED